MNRNRILGAVVVAVLVFSVFVLAGLRDLGPFLIPPPTAREVDSFKSFDRCTTYGQDNSIAAQGDYAIAGSKVVDRGGENYVAAEITGLLSLAAPGPILLTAPFSVNGVTYSSPGSEAWTATYTAGFLFVTMTFADGANRNLSVVLAPPLYSGDGCVALASSGGQEAGFLVLLSPTTESGPWVFQLGSRFLRMSVYAIVQA